MNGFLRWLVLVAAAVLFFGVKDAEACACVTREMSPEQNRQDVAEQLEKATAVFSGEVMRQDTLTVQFSLEDVWKGEFGEHVVMPINAGQNPDGTVAYSSCDYGFQVGRKIPRLRLWQISKHDARVQLHEDHRAAACDEHSRTARQDRETSSEKTARSVGTTTVSAARG